MTKHENKICIINIYIYIYNIYKTIYQRMTKHKNKIFNCEYMKNTKKTAVGGHGRHTFPELQDIVH